MNAKIERSNYFPDKQTTHQHYIKQKRRCIALSKFSFMPSRRRSLTPALTSTKQESPTFPPVRKQNPQKHGKTCSKKNGTEKVLQLISNT
mmetsp:Transcript_9838/g.14757  ORF Transcript_9838/g.14757 Transcript_9838/m.14757 type:complete len:90 (-) Transcript_9838:825-1094(-)